LIEMSFRIRYHTFAIGDPTWPTYRLRGKGNRLKIPVKQPPILLSGLPGHSGLGRCVHILGFAGVKTDFEETRGLEKKLNPDCTNCHIFINDFEILRRERKNSPKGILLRGFMEPCGSLRSVFLPGLAERQGDELRLRTIPFGPIQHFFAVKKDISNVKMTFTTAGNTRFDADRMNRLVFTLSANPFGQSRRSDSKHRGGNPPIPPRSQHGLGTQCTTRIF
jgi:hypothetical protein